MKYELRTEILISASPQKVWEVLTDFENYPKWNPFIKSIEGKPLVGEKITVRLEPPDAKGITMTPKVLAFDVNKQFRWIGNFVLPGLFDGEHIFELTDNKDGTTTFIQRENFKGILVGSFKKMLDNNTKRGFELMNQQLKIRSEQ
jgi:hypothetical protein